MQVKKVQNNTGFYGFEFKNTKVKQIFEEKLGKISQKSAENIKQYIKKTSTEKNRIIINSTDSMEYHIFATFPDCDTVISEPCYQTNSLIKFIKKCAAQAGYEPIKFPKSNKVK